MIWQLPHGYPWRGRTHYGYGGQWYRAHRFVMDPCRGERQHHTCEGHAVVCGQAVAYCSCSCHSLREREALSMTARVSEAPSPA